MTVLKKCNVLPSNTTTSPIPYSEIERRVAEASLSNTLPNPHPSHLHDSGTGSCFPEGQVLDVKTAKDRQEAQDNVQINLKLRFLICVCVGDWSPQVLVNWQCRRSIAEAQEMRAKIRPTTTCCLPLQIVSPFPTPLLLFTLLLCLYLCLDRLILAVESVCCWQIFDYGEDPVGDLRVAANSNVRKKGVDPPDMALTPSSPSPSLFSVTLSLVQNVSFIWAGHLLEKSFYLLNVGWLLSNTKKGNFLIISE